MAISVKAGQQRKRHYPIVNGLSILLRDAFLWGNEKLYSDDTMFLLMYNRNHAALTEGHSNGSDLLHEWRYPHPSPWISVLLLSNR